MNKMQTMTSTDGCRSRRSARSDRAQKPSAGGLMLSIPLSARGDRPLLVADQRQRRVETDNAAVKQDIVSVSAQVNGPVIEVRSKNGDNVKRGDVLFRIDPAPFQVALEQAEAQLAAARLQTSQLRTQAAGTGADITGAQANLADQAQCACRARQALAEARLHDPRRL